MSNRWWSPTPVCCARSGRRASIVLLGIDQAARVAAQQLPRRAEVYVLGDDRAPAEAYRWSTPLGAAVLLLPSGATWLAGALADLSGQRPGAGRVICVVGGSGGAGASTCAAALAFVSAQTHRSTLLVDADPTGGGLDLLLGAERVTGWRWPRLASARGHLGDFGGQLPRVEDIDVLSMARGTPSGGHGLSPVSVKAVLLSAMRSHDLIVVDLPRSLGPASREAILRADLVLLVVRDRHPRCRRGPRGRPRRGSGRIAAGRGRPSGPIAQPRPAAGRDRPRDRPVRDGHR